MLSWMMIIGYWMTMGYVLGMILNIQYLSLRPAGCHLLHQQRSGNRIRTTTPTDILHFGVEDLLDFADWFDKADGHIVVATLEQDFALKVEQFVFACSQQETDQFVVDVIVDLWKMNLIRNHRFYLQ